MTIIRAALNVSAGISTNLSSPTSDVLVNEYNTLSAANISATDKIFNSGISSFTGTKYISLNAGFEAKTGAVFKANIGGCGY